MKQLTPAILAFALAMLAILPSYWALLFVMDSLIGSSQLHTWVLYESRHALLTQFLSDAPLLLAAYAIPLAILTLIFYRGWKPAKSFLLLTILVTAAVISLLFIGYHASQILLSITAPLLSLALAIFVTNQLCQSR